MTISMQDTAYEKSSTSSEAEAVGREPARYDLVVVVGWSGLTTYEAEGPPYSPASRNDGLIRGCKQGLSRPEALRPHIRAGKKIEPIQRFARSAFRVIPGDARPGTDCVPYSFYLRESLNRRGQPAVRFVSSWFLFTQKPATSS
jgi:hypothetical protein